MGSNRLMLWVTAFLVTAVLATTGVLLYKRTGGPLSFTLLFKNARQLRPGQFVTYKGVRIGDVKSVELDQRGQVRVGVEIYSEHRDKVYQEAVYKIER